MRDGIVTHSTVLSCDSTHCSVDSVEKARKLFGTMRVKVITAPGMDALLAGVLRPGNDAEVARVRAQAEATVKELDSKQCLIMGHCNCRANPVDEETHRAQLEFARRTVESWGLFHWVEIGIFGPDWKYAKVA